MLGTLLMFLRISTKSDTLSSVRSASHVTLSVNTPAVFNVVTWSVLDILKHNARLRYIDWFCKCLSYIAGVETELWSVG